MPKNIVNLDLLHWPPKLACELVDTKGRECVGFQTTGADPRTAAQDAPKSVLQTLGGPLQALGSTCDGKLLQALTIPSKTAAASRTERRFMVVLTIGDCERNYKR